VAPCSSIKGLSMGGLVLDSILSPWSICLSYTDALQCLTLRIFMIWLVVNFCGYVCLSKMTLAFPFPWVLAEIFIWLESIY
jgi:hypothetical protein